MSQGEAAPQTGVGNGRGPSRRRSGGAAGSAGRLRFFWLFAAAAVLSPLSGAHGAGDDRWGWFYCAPPYPPGCVGSPAGDRQARLLCEQAVDAYVASVFRYRACLAKEMERAVLEANKTLQIVKCPRDKRYCYGLPR